MRTESAPLLSAALLAVILAGCTSEEDTVDLRFSGSPTISPGRPEAGDIVTISWSVYNDNDDAVAGLRWTVTDLASGDETTGAYGTIAAGGSAAAEVEVQSQAGTRTYEIAIDSDDDLDETAEGNNTKRIEIVWTGAPEAQLAEASITGSGDGGAVIGFSMVNNRTTDTTVWWRIVDAGTGSVAASGSRTLASGATSSLIEHDITAANRNRAYRIEVSLSAAFTTVADEQTLQLAGG